jgi:hypothetical protein
MMKKIVRYFVLINVLLSLVLLVLILLKPSIPTITSGPEAAQSFQQKVAQLAEAHERGTPAEVRLTSEEVNSQFQGAAAAAQDPTNPVKLKQTTVYLEDDKLVTVLVADVKGVDLVLSIVGRLNFSGHSVTLVPTQLRIGRLPVPVSWLRGKMNLQMDVPELITGARIENGELVLQSQ